MEPLSCPECKVPLTSEEAERGQCPCCQEALPAWVVREGERRQFRSSGPRTRSARSLDVPDDHLPTLARVARWTIRISGAGMIFVGAGCFGVSMLAAFLPTNLAPGQKGEMISLFMTGCTGLFILLFVSLLVGLGLKVLAGDNP